MSDDDDTSAPPMPPDTMQLPVAGSSPAGRSPFDRRDNRFESRGELGRGGMGRIDDAFDHALGRPVAIKHLLRGDEVDRVRFEREARITARLEHPGIVPLHEAGRSPDGTPFYVMRRVDGRPLAELVVDATPDERLALIPNVLAACDAIAYAHARGIVHRDLKPTNILVGPFGETLVIDWGLAREIDPDAAASGIGIPVSDGNVTVAGMVAGTPGFMAPEQARGESVDARADVFALGATLFYVLAAKSPYDGITPTEMIDRAGAGKPPSWKALPADLPADLRAIVMKALAPESDARYANAGTLAADLRRFVTGNLVRAHTYGRLERLRRFVRRHRAAIAVGVISVLVLAVGAIVSVRGILAERDDANTARAVAEARQREARDAADNMLVQRAQMLATQDPIGTIGLLRQLAPDSARWRDAWLAAVAAWSRGIPSGFRADSKILWVALAGDNHRAAVTTYSGRVTIYDLAARSETVVASMTHAENCQFIADARLICRHDRHVVLLDVGGGMRELGFDSDLVYTDRKSRAVAETLDHRILAIDADGTTREIARDAQLAGVDPELAQVGLVRHGMLELWTPAATYPLSKVATPQFMVDVRAGRIGGMIDGEVVRWHLDGDHVVTDSRSPRAGGAEVMLAGSGVYSLAPMALRRVQAVVHPDDLPLSMFPTPRGVGAFLHDGSILLVDETSYLPVGPLPQRFEHGDLSTDGRFLVATTDADELLVWDLATLRPTTFSIDNSEEPVALVPPDLWALDQLGGLVLHEGNKPGVEVLTGAVDARSRWYFVAPDGTWAAMRDPQKDRLQVYDHRSRKAGFVDAVVQAADDVSMVVVRGDRSVGRWHPGRQDVTSIGQFSRVPDVLAVDGDTVVGALDRHVMRLTGEEADVPADVQSIVVEAGGRAWLALESGAVMKWELPGQPVVVPLAEPATGVYSYGDHALAHTQRTLVALGDTPRPVLADARRSAWMGDDYFAIVTASSAIGLVDLHTGSTFDLRFGTQDDDVVAHGDTILIAPTVVTTQRDLASYTIPVPHDPAKLRQWIATITNLGE